MSTIHNLTELAMYLGVEPGFSDTETLKAISRVIYKYTDCGAWISVFRWEDGDAASISLGSIVEGCAAEVCASPLAFPFTEGDFDETVAWVEGEAAALWAEAHDCDCDDPDPDDIFNCEEDV